MPRWGTVGDDGRVYMGGNKVRIHDGVDLDLDPDLDRKVQHLPTIRAKTRAAAEKVAEIARSTAPVDTGRYVEGIDVDETGSGYRVISHDQKSAWIEFGVPARNQPARWVLRNAAIAAGLKFRKRSG